MLRLAHRILSQQSIDLPPYPTESNRRDVLILHKATIDRLTEGEPVIIADNIAAYTNNLRRVDDNTEGIPLPKWCRRQRVRELKYHSLRIDPNIGSKPRPSERKTEGDRSGRALHICRGYFMHCVNDGVNKGLFGKGIYGTFWVPSHVRGSAELGKVIPTYNVLAPMVQQPA